VYSPFLRCNTAAGWVDATGLSRRIRRPVPESIRFVYNSGMSQLRSVIFDLGNVLIGWDPRNLYRKLFAEDGAGERAAMERFLAEVCTGQWNLEQDRGRSFADGVAHLLAEHPPELHDFIRAYDERWDEMLSDELAGAVAVLEDLHAAQTPLYALTNWNQDKFTIARKRYAWLACFRGIVVSGEEGLVKPDPALYHVLLERYRLQAEACVFIDDSQPNVEAANALGMRGLLFRSANQLRSELRGLGFQI
jgi:2-haloacid dehalogenase